MHERLTLRQLSLASRLVLSCFLCAVGLGYFSALVQLHLQHGSRDGNPLPTPEDVVSVFAGVKRMKAGEEPPTPVTKLERLIMGPVEGAPWNGSGSMAPAFYHKDGADYRTTVRDEPAKKKQLDAERDGERNALKAWIALADAERKKSYTENRMTLPAALAGKPVSSDYLHDNKSDVKVKSILDDRCARCHAKDAEQEKYPLETYEQIGKYLELPPPDPAAKPGDWIPSGRLMSVEKLTQSTHAHLLSFAMLFTLTGLVFSFSSYPGWMRCILGPIVLVAQVADVSCWWLARVPTYGPYFAQTIIATGGIVGLGLGMQIILSLLDMYGRRGRAVLVLLFLVAGAGFAVLFTNVIGPELAAEKGK